MKRLLAIISIILPLLSSCGGGGLKDIEVRSLEIVSFTPRGFRDVDAVLRVKVCNPSVDVEVTDFGGVLKLRGADVMKFTAEPLKISGKSEEYYLLPLHGSLDEGFNPFQLLEFFSRNGEDRLSPDDLTFDVKLRPVLNNGVGRNIEYKDIHINDFLIRK